MRKQMTPGTTMDSFPFEIEEEDEHQEYLNWAFSPPESFYLPSAISDPQPPPRSAFVEYRTFHGGISSQSSGCQQQQSGGRNIHRRVIGFLRTIPMVTRQESSRDVVAEASKEFQRLMRERERRERLSQCFADLRYILSNRSKGDKNSVVQAAAVYLKELKGAREELEKRNEELEEMAAGKGGVVEGAMIKLSVMSPSSAVDSMMGALQCMRRMEVEVASMQADVSSQGLSAVVNLKSKNVAIAEVQRAMECALEEAEKNSYTLSSQQCKYFVSCHVENAP